MMKAATMTTEHSLVTTPYSNVTHTHTHSSHVITIKDIGLTGFYGGGDPSI